MRRSEGGHAKHRLFICGTAAVLLLLGLTAPDTCRAAEQKDAPAGGQNPLGATENPAAAAQGTEPAAAAQENGEGAAARPKRLPVEITAEEMDMDFGARVATFTGNVRVVEERLALVADKIIAFFDENNEPERIEALGNVTITQDAEERKATAGRAIYDTAKGTIVLSDTPVLQTGRNRLTGADEIHYNRTDERVKTRGGQPRIQVVPEGEEDVFPDLRKTDTKDGN